MIALYYFLIGILFSAFFTCGRIWESGWKEYAPTFGGFALESLAWPIMVALTIFIIIDDIRGRD